MYERNMLTNAELERQGFHVVNPNMESEGKNENDNDEDAEESEEGQDDTSR